MIECDYGCGNKAKHQFKNGKWCCEKHYTKCPINASKISKQNKGNIPWNKNINGCFNDETIEKMRKSHLGKKDSEETKQKKRQRATGRKHNIQTKNKMSQDRKGSRLKKKTKDKISKKLKELWNNNDSIFNSDEWKQKNKQTNKRTIKKIQNKYLLFSKIEEMRYKPGERKIQVHCKNHNCPNSKEKDGWFTPEGREIEQRIYAIESLSKDNSYFYCSEECKNECPLYYSHGTYPLKNELLIYTSGEYQIFRDHVLERDGYKCQYCEKKAEHVHHERPQKLEPFFALDPDLAWSVCKICHYEKGHQNECSTGNIANKVC
ncbi:MAG TPA: hypothetical protein VMX17_08405 [Candidatus Glassbacteria bacterium]|nr:hypothetical protein [Candidatus Glassbacteria bacterium]